MSYTINLANNILAFQGTLTRPLRHQEKLVKQLCELAIAKESRIAELEAEVERLKAFCNEWVYNEEAFQKQSAVEICPLITEEGQG